MNRRRGLLAAAAAMVVLALAVLVRTGWDPLADADISADAHAHHLMRLHTVALGWVRAATHLGDPLVVAVLAAIAALICWLLRRRTDALYLLAVRVAGIVTGAALKDGVARARPSFGRPLAHATGYSFPSGHALGAAATYLSVALVASSGRPVARRVAVPLALFVAVVVATTRVLLGVHFPSDVAAGLVLGWAIALVGRSARSREARVSSGP